MKIQNKSQIQYRQHRNQYRFGWMSGGDHGIIVGQRKRGHKVPERGEGLGGGTQGVFAFSELKLSDLVHTLGENFGKLSVQNVHVISSCA